MTLSLDVRRAYYEAQLRDIRVMRFDYFAIRLARNSRADLRQNLMNLRAGHGLTLEEYKATFKL